MTVTQAEVDARVTWIKERREAIMAAFREGDSTAKTIVTAYSLFAKCPEDAAWAVLDACCAAWEKEQASTINKGVY